MHGAGSLNTVTVIILQIKVMQTRPEHSTILYMRNCVSGTRSIVNEFLNSNDVKMAAGCKTHSKA